MNIIRILWHKALFLAIILLLTGCSASPAQPGVGTRAAIALPTRAPKPTLPPANTRVLPIESLTPAPTPTVTPIPDEARAVVVGVIDGRTIGVVMQGDSPRHVYLVRYLGIDTPPTHDPWGAAAYDVNRKMTALKVVRLVRDQSDFDSEGNLLRYVYVDDALMSIILAEQGLARAAITPPDTRFQAEILEAETRAKQGQLGLWSGGAPTPRPAEGTVITPTITLTVTVLPVTPTIISTGDKTPTATATP